MGILVFECKSAYEYTELIIKIPKNMRRYVKDTIFREYDIRGKVGSEFIIDEAYALARAIAYYFVQQKPDLKTLAVGMDGRTHSPAFKEEIVRGLRDSGIDVIFIGVCPSPVLYFALHMLPVDGGLMITASHNPKEYNGIKMCLNKESIWAHQILAIRDAYKSKKQHNASQLGTMQEKEMVPLYVDWLVKHFEHLKGMSLSAVVDCGNGAAGTVLPQLVEAMRWSNVQLLYPEVDGNYPHHEADPTHEANMADVKHTLATTDISVGMGLDGDCDRMAPMTKEGELILGDKLLALFAQPILKQHPGSCVVFDIKASAGLIELLNTWGAKPCVSATGHTNIKVQMKEHQAILGGELSCHFFFHDRYFGFDDGIYALMRLFELLVQTGKSLGELLAVFPHKYSSVEYRIACPEEKKQSIVRDATKVFSVRPSAKVITLDGVRVTMPYGWGLVRASNTQPMLSLRFESDSLEGLKKIKSDFIDVLGHDFNTETLKTELDVA
jgi:phosphomannomutase/phosphoglucomutase